MNSNLTKKAFIEAAILKCIKENIPEDIARRAVTSVADDLEKDNLIKWIPE